MMKWMSSCSVPICLPKTARERYSASNRIDKNDAASRLQHAGRLWYRAIIHQTRPKEINIGKLPHQVDVRLSIRIEKKNLPTYREFSHILTTYLRLFLSCECCSCLIIILKLQIWLNSMKFDKKKQKTFVKLYAQNICMVSIFTSINTILM